MDSGYIVLLWHTPKDETFSVSIVYKVLHGVLGLIFKVIILLRLLKVFLGHHLLNGWLIIDQTCIDILFGD